MTTSHSKPATRRAQSQSAVRSVAAVAHAAVAPPAGRIDAAARRLDDDIISITPERLLAIAIDIPTMVTTLLGCAPRILAMAPALASLPYYNAAPASHIEDYAFALFDAHQRTIGVVTNRVFDRQVQRAMKLRSRFFATLDVLVAWDQFDAAAVADLRAGTGYKDLAGDLVSCVRNLRALAASVREHLLVTDAELDEAMTLAAEIERTVGIRENGDVVGGVDPRVRRQQAYTLCIEMWDEVRRGVQFIRYHHGDAETIAPTLFAKNGARRASGSEPATSEPPAAPVATPAAPTVPDAAASATIASAKNGSPSTA